MVDALKAPNLTTSLECRMPCGVVIELMNGHDVQLDPV